MTIEIKIIMPVPVYHAFLGRCVMPSREYAILRNSLIYHLPDANPSDWIQILCDQEDTDIILAHARKFFPDAAPYIERSIGSYLIDRPRQALEYRKHRTGDTWHFVAACSHWPSEDFYQRQDPPHGDELCNECLVRSLQQGSS